jgi:putative hemolysin
MTHVSEVVAINLDDSVEEIRRKFSEAQHSKYPVVDKSIQRIIGIVQVKDVLSSFMESGKLNIKEHLSEAHFISENTNCLKVLEMFKSSSINLAVVIDEYGAIEGIVTDSDIFEAVVGLIPANYDESDSVMITMRDDCSWLVDGVAPIDEINIVIGIEEMNLAGKYDTLSGFILDNLKEMPKEGVKFAKYGHSFEIMDMDGSRIDKILITNIANALKK